MCFVCVLYYQKHCTYYCMYVSVFSYQRLIWMYSFYTIIIVHIYDHCKIRKRTRTCNKWKNNYKPYTHQSLRWFHQNKYRHRSGNQPPITKITSYMTLIAVECVIRKMVRLWFVRQASSFLYYTKLWLIIFMCLQWNFTSVNFLFTWLYLTCYIVSVL